MDKLKRTLAFFAKKTIGLKELEVMFNPYCGSYEDFSVIVLALEIEGTLTMVKAKGRTTRIPTLAFQYRINKSFLVEDFHKELQEYRRSFHPAMNLDEYYRKDPAIWKNDLPYLEKIDRFLKENGFPNQEVPAPERSYEVVEDEKWIVEKGGKEVLERIGIFNKLQIIPVSEPLMFAINPLKLDEPVQYHLIVENKTTYQGLLPAIKDTNFSTLIYGSGKAIVKSIEQFSRQYPIEAKHLFFYFGDIDREGIAIWNSLNQRQHATPAVPFYQQCLQKKAAQGKDYQKDHQEAQRAFLPYFPQEEQQQIRSLLESGLYHPQETLKTNELQQIWRESNWTSWIY